MLICDICCVCTKVVTVNVRQLSVKLQANIIASSQDGLAAIEAIERISKDNVLPTDLTPVITHNRPREIQYMRWGLVPAFAKDPKSVSAMFNARAETLSELPSFKDLIMSSRCLILNEGFYENETQGDERVQWKISPAQEDYFYKAGLWTTWRNPETGETLDSFTMITCDPKKTEFSRVHDRIPIIMTRPERRLWMSVNSTKEQLLALLKPCDASLYNITEYNRKPLKTKRPSKAKGSDDSKLF